jgi:hypothetical protein
MGNWGLTLEWFAGATWVVAVGCDFDIFAERYR